MQRVWSVCVCTPKIKCFSQHSKDPKTPQDSFPLCALWAVMMMSRAAQIYNNITHLHARTRTQNPRTHNARHLITRHTHCQAQKDTHKAHRRPHKTGARRVKGEKIPPLKKQKNFPLLLVSDRLSVAECVQHLSPWFKVIAKVMIHKAGMVQPSAFRFLPSALLPRKDTINSSKPGKFNWNPL